MAAVQEDDEAEAARAFRPNVRPLAIAVAANALLAVLFLGLPYYRGQLQAESSLRAYRSFAACLLDAEQGSALGLGMPRGERERFAGLFMLGPASWPARCVPGLRAIAPEEATFLWPSVKQAGADVRALVKLQESELGQVGKARAEHGRVPERPLLALARLRGGLTLLARAGGADEDVDSDAVRFSKPSPATEPSRLPLVAGASAPLSVSAGQDGLRALALDGRGISVLRVAEGKIDRRRVRRTSLVRGARELDGEPLLLWAMSPERCAQAADRCARRAMGAAVLGPEALVLPEPTWLGAHPYGRVDRSVRVGLGRKLDVLAVADSAGGLEVRRFGLPQATPATAAATPDAAEAGAQAEGAGATAPRAPPLPPEWRIALPASAGPSDALLLQSTHAAVYTVAGGDGQDAFLLGYGSAGAGVEGGRPPAVPLALGHARGQGAWITACEHAAGAVIVFGTDAELLVARVAHQTGQAPTGAEAQTATQAPSAASTPTAVLSAPLALPLGAPLTADDPGSDRVRVLCDEASALLVIATANGELRALRCDAERCGPGDAEPLATHVSGFDAVRTPAGALVAYSEVEEPQLRVLRLDAHGAPRGIATTPAACWDPAGGMCGKPTLAADSGRLLLCARDGSDLLALESDDGGARWKPLSGLKVGSATSTDAKSPMDQHRLRKGLE